MIKNMVVIALLMNSTSVFASEAIDSLLKQYQTEAAVSFDTQRGQAFWQQPGATGIACTSCHGADAAASGKHNKTGKVILPMASSVNPARFIDAAFIEKWLFRNCKAVHARTCTVQEKGDVLLWLSQQ